MISVVVPIYNEEKVLSVNSLYFQSLSKKAELIFTDGGSTDKSREIAKKYGMVLNGKKGRAAQMNYGGTIAKQDILLFLHADTSVSAETLLSIEKMVKERGFIGGCLTQRIDKGAFIYRIIEWQGNIRARLLREFYGDQGIFVRKDIFSKINGFPQTPIMEDVIFSKKLRKQGKVVVLADKIVASARRWEKHGIIKTILLYNLIVFLFLLRAPLAKIKSLYDDLR